MNWSAVVLDIEGTTTPIAFVYEVLFPFARRRLRSYIRDPRHAGELREALGLLKKEFEADSAGPAHAGRHDLEASVERLMDEDRKSPGLKALQGLIWQDGYRTGELKGEVFPDVAPAFRLWRDRGVRVAIYSSGSELAQRLLFGNTSADGDLTPLIARYFDTRVGAKVEADSYRTIVRELDRPAGDVLFISDVTAELDAARTAGCQTRLCLRPGNRSQPPNHHETIRTFDDIL